MKAWKIRARGRGDLQLRYRSKLFVTVKEQEWVEGEKRVGRFGRRQSTLTKTEELIKAKGLKTEDLRRKY